MFSSNQNSHINTGRGDLDLFLKTNRGELSGTTNRAIDESSDSLSRTKNISPVKTPVPLWFPSGITPLDSSASSLFLSDTFPTEELFNPQVLKEATLNQHQTEARHVSEIEKSGPEVDRKSHEQQVKPKYANVKLDEYMR